MCVIGAFTIRISTSYFIAIRPSRHNATSTTLWPIRVMLHKVPAMRSFHSCTKHALCVVLYVTLGGGGDGYVHTKLRRAQPCSNHVTVQTKDHTRFHLYHYHHHQLQHCLSWLRGKEGLSSQDFLSNRESFFQHSGGSHFWKKETLQQIVRMDWRSSLVVVHSDVETIVPKEGKQRYDK